MYFNVCDYRYTRLAAIILCSAILFGILASVSNAVTTFGTHIRPKQKPASFDADGIWFYDQHMTRVIPDINLDWISVVFRGGLVAPEGSDARTQSETVFLQRAKQIVESYDEIIDFFYDHNLAKDACFFKLREGLKGNLLGGLIAALNTHPFVAYTHPTIKINNKNYAFFNAFDLEWKTGVAKELKESIMSKAHVAWDKNEYTYRVRLAQIPFFTAINLLAEDIHVLRLTPYLVELKPSIHAELSIPLSGSNIGDKIPFSLNIAFSDLVTVDPSSLANLSLRPTNIQKELFELKFDPYDYAQVVRTSPITITGWMKFYTPGEFTIPSIHIQYTSATYADNKEKSIETKPLPFKVSSILPSKQPEKKLVIPMDRLEPDYGIAHYHQQAKSNLLWSLSFFFMALMCAGWVILRLYEAKKEKEKLLATKREDVLAEELKAFLSKGPSRPHSTYMGEVSKLLRSYLVAKHRIGPHPSGGSGSVFFESVKDKLPPTLVPKVGALFKRIDDIVALELDTFPGIESLRSEVLEIIDAS